MDVLRKRTRRSLTKPWLVKDLFNDADFSLSPSINFKFLSSKMYTPYEGDVRILILGQEIHNFKFEIVSFYLSHVLVLRIDA